MSPILFLENDFRAILQYFFDRNRSIRGYKSKTADAAKCSRSFLSQVMHGQACLSYDQGIRIAKFWALGARETDFFLGLIALERCGSPELRGYYTSKLQQMRKDQSNVANHIQDKRTLATEHAPEYYSSWLYQAVHVSVSLPHLKTVDSLAERFGCHRDHITHVLQRLILMGLVDEDPDGGWRVSNVHTHVDRRSPNFTSQHRSWRIRSCEDAVLRQEDAVLYSGVFTLSRESADKIKALLLEVLATSHQTIIASKEEDAFCLQIDWFRT